VSGAATGLPAGVAPNSATTSIDHSASNLRISGLKPGGVQGADFGSLSAPTGGSVSVNDTFHDKTGSSHQTGSGPTKPGGDGNGVQITLDQTNCTYQVMVSFGITTQTTANPGEPNDPGVGDNATSPAMPIPSNLVLKGHATIPASAGGGTGGGHGLYDLSGDPSWSFAIEFVAPTTPEPGTANITWDLNPAGAPATALRRAEGHGADRESGSQGAQESRLQGRQGLEVTLEEGRQGCRASCSSRESPPPGPVPPHREDERGGYS
jgi:hypothetical protein